MVIAAAGGKVRDVPWPFVAGGRLLGIGPSVFAAAMDCLVIDGTTAPTCGFTSIGRGAGPRRVSGRVGSGSLAAGRWLLAVGVGGVAAAAGVGTEPRTGE